MIRIHPTVQTKEGMRKRENAKGGESEKIVHPPLNHGLWLRGGEGRAQPAIHREREREAFIIPKAFLSEELGQFEQEVNNWFNYKTNFPRALERSDWRALPLSLVLPLSLPLFTIMSCAPQVGESLTSSSSHPSLSLCANEWGKSWWPGETLGSGGRNPFRERTCEYYRWV